MAENSKAQNLSDEAERVKEIIDKIHSEIDSKSSEVQREAEEVEEEQQELDGMEDETEQRIQSDGEEIQEGEQDANPVELEDAADRQQKIEEMIEQQEKIVLDSIEEIEQELEQLQNEAYDFSEANKSLIEVLRDFGKELDSIFENFRQNADHPQKQLIRQNFNDLEEVLGSLNEIGELIAVYLSDQEVFISQLMGVEKQEFMLENNTQELAKELEVDEEEIEELIQDARQMGDREMLQETEQEEERLQNLKQRYKKEDSEEDAIDRYIQQELQESETIIEEDEEIVEEAGQILKELEDLEDFLIEQQDRFQPLVSARIYKTVFNDLHSTKESLRSTIQRDRSEFEELRSRLGDAFSAGKKIKQNSDTRTTNADWSGILSNTLWVIVMLLVSIIVILVAFSTDLRFL